MILILGKGTLANSLQQLYPEATLVGKPEYDFSSQTDCDKLISTYDPEIIINTVGVGVSSDIWNILTTNYVSAVYLTIGFYKKMKQGQIINVSSASAIWTSWPDITDERLAYNLSKESLTNFGRHFNRKIVDNDNNTTITTVEIGKFASKLNDWQSGMAVEKAVQVIHDCIENPCQQITVVR
jgi:NAD(P)-dependent dehydrogenase (short-subunit alcohol dehydrogenase family)